MPHASRSLIALLVATVAFFALWIVALKPSSSNTPAKSGGVGQLQSAINAARASAAAQNHAAAAGGNTVATTPAHHAATPAATAKTAKPTVTRATPAATPATAGQRLGVVDRALADHRVLALLFYNPAAPDDQAVRHELTTIPTSHGRVVKLAVPLSELANYPAITNQVQIETSPTLVIIDRSAQAFTLAGFADQFEIAQRVVDALSIS